MLSTSEIPLHRVSLLPLLHAVIEHVQILRRLASDFLLTSVASLLLAGFVARVYLPLDDHRQCIWLTFRHLKNCPHVHQRAVQHPQGLPPLDILDQQTSARILPVLRRSKTSPIAHTEPIIRTHIPKLYHNSRRKAQHVRFRKGRDQQWTINADEEKIPSTYGLRLIVCFRQLPSQREVTPE